MSWNETKPAEDAGGPPATSTFVRSIMDGVAWNSLGATDADNGLKAMLDEVAAKMDVEHYFTTNDSKTGTHKKGSAVAVLGAGEQALSTGQLGVNTTTHMLHFSDGAIQYPLWKASAVIMNVCPGVENPPGAGVYSWWFCVPAATTAYRLDAVYYGAGGSFDIKNSSGVSILVGGSVALPAVPFPSGFVTSSFSLSPYEGQAFVSLSLVGTTDISGFCLSVNEAG